MAESAIFILLAGTVLILIFYAFGITSIDPRIILTLVLVFLIPGAYAAITSGPFVPSSRKRHKAMLDLAELELSDVVYDIGCGDGRLVFRAAPFVKKVIGYELSIPLYLFGKIRQLFNPKNAHIRYGNIWKQDYKDANVIFVYLLPKAMKQFYKEIWPTLKPGTRVVSNAFQIHEIKPIQKEGKVYLYQV